MSIQGSGALIKLHFFGIQTIFLRGTLPFFTSMCVFGDWQNSNGAGLRLETTVRFENRHSPSIYNYKMQNYYKKK